MKQAIIILWHNNVRNLLRLVDYFDETFDVFIHVDRKVRTPSALAGLQTSRDNLYVMRKTRIYWGGLSILKAELALFELACHTGDYSYIHLISGEDYPLIPLEDFKRFFAGNDREYLEYHDYPSAKWNNGGNDRLRFYWPMDLPFLRGNRNSRMIPRLIELQCRLNIDRGVPDKFGLLYGGSNWISITGRCASYLISSPVRKRLLHRLRYTFAPDEFFFQTVILNSPFREKVENNNLRYIDWGKGLPSPSVLNEIHISPAVRSGCMFARKIEEGKSDGFRQAIDSVLSQKRKPVEREGKSYIPTTRKDGVVNIYFVQIFDNEINGVSVYAGLVGKIFMDESRFRFTRLVFSSPRECMGLENGFTTIHVQLPPKEGIRYLSKIGIVDEQGNNLFMHNFCPASPTVCAIRECFPASRIVYVIHDFIWLAMFNGDWKKYEDFIREGMLPAGLSDKKAFLQALYQDVRNAAISSDILLCHNEDTENLLCGFYGVKKDYVKMIKIGLPDVAVTGKADMACRANDKLKDSSAKAAMDGIINCGASEKADFYDNSRKFIYIGRLTPQKGFDTLMVAAGLLYGYDSEARIVVVGDDSGFKGPVPANMVLTGIVGNDRLVELIGAMDFGIVASRYEQCGIAGIEMKRAGLPVISSDAFGVRQMFNKNNSLVFKTGDGYDLFLKMKEALLMPETELDMYSNRSKNDFMRRFSFNRMREGYMSMVESLF